MIHAHANRPDGYVSKLIRRTTRAIVRGPGFSSSDTEDLQQDFWLHLLEREHSFDPARSSYPTFADRLIANKAKDILRNRHAQRRSPNREAFSVNGEVTDSSGCVTSTHETLASREPDPHRLSALQDDIVTLYEALPDDEQRVLVGKLAALTHQDIRKTFGLTVRRFDAAWKRVRSAVPNGCSVPRAPSRKAAA